VVTILSQILSSVLILKFGEFEGSASGLPAIVALVMIVGLIVLARRWKS
jgi:hypothetical protein